MPKSDNSLLIFGAVAAGGYYAYTQGWLSFLGSIGTPSAASPTPLLVVAPVDTSAQIAAAAAAQAAALKYAADQAAAAQAATDAATAAAQVQAAINRRRYMGNPGYAVPPVAVDQRDPGRVATTPVGVSGIQNGYGLRGWF